MSIANPVTIDFETFYSKKLKYSLTTSIAETYCKHDLFDPYMLAVYDGTNSWVGQPKNFNWNAITGRDLLAHNAYFEATILKELQERQWVPKLNHSSITCTANMTSYLCGRRSLDAAVERLFGAKIDKSARADAVERKWPDGFTPAEREVMQKYALGDVLWTHRLFAEHGARWPEVERQLSRITIDQGMKGVQINTELLEEYICRSHEMKMTTENVIPWIKDAGDDEWEDFFDEHDVKAKPTSTKCIAEQCRRERIPCPPVKSEDEEAYDLWENTYKEGRPWILALSAWRSANKLYRTFLVMKSRLRSDGTMPFALLYFGAHCMPGDHEVLTPKGWMPLKDWSGGKIMQRRPDGALEFADAYANRFDNVKEKLVSLKNGQLECQVTEGHWVATLNKFGTLVKRQAADIFGTGQEIPISAPYSGGEAIPAFQVKLIAATQADGHYLPGNEGLRFRFSRERKILRMRELLKGSDLNWEETQYPSEPGVTIFRIRDLPGWLKDRKEWDARLLGWNFRALDTLVKELVHWDGYQCGPGSIEYTTTSKNNSEWVVTVAHLTGRAAVITERPRQGNWATAYRVYIRNESSSRVKPEGWAVAAGEAGTVFCPTSLHGVCLFRFRGQVFISGQTGRWSGTAKINFQNQRRKPVFCNEAGLMEMNEKRTDAAMKSYEEQGIWPDWVKFTIDFRKLIIPRPGKKMIVSDLSQIEPRVLAWLTGDTALFEMLKKGIGIYEAHAVNTMSWKSGEKPMKKANPGLYSLAKVRVLGLGYGAGWEKFITMAATLSGGEIDLTKDDPEFVMEQDMVTGHAKQVSGYGTTSKRIVKEFREANPRIVGLWKQLDDGLKRSVGEDFTITLPSGRIMRYEKVKCERRIEPDPKSNRPMSRSVYTVGIGHKRVITYGGKLTENLVQGAARDVFGEQLVRMDAKGMPSLFTCHDENIAEVDQGVTAYDLRHEMSYCPPWLEGCPIDAEAHEVAHYCK